MHILLVDDEKELVATLAERLSMRGIEADWATTGEEALAYAASRTYDLALLDIKMPRMGGLELKKKLHTLHPEMKFIFLTGHGSEEDFVTGASEAGADNYLIKPVNIQTLIAKISKALKEIPHSET
ncbi:response regulator [Desulfonema ishimotonii]|uniref:Response regulator n=2 Tax=Desulfonema ishimotonii TaxID=45657 RepID=A0A401FW79_9BACT|nr:response regulator [Desulfonema ishimotonii]GBC61242.1 response regulator [Desulfonema ishimotonii]